MKGTASLKCAIAVFATGFVTFVPPLAYADDDPRIKPWTFYGQLNSVLINVDNGNQSETFVADNDVSNSRIGIFYEWFPSNGNTLRFNFETALGLNGTSTSTMDDNSISFDYSESEELRKLEFQYSTLDAGTFSLGQGSMATDGIAEADLSGTTVISTSSVADLAGSFKFQNNDPAADDITVSRVFSNFDGARRFRVRYDAPAFHGIIVSLSAGKELLDDTDNRNFYDIGAVHKDENDTRVLERRLGLSIADKEKVVIGSLAYLNKDNGVSFTLSGGSNRDKSGNYLYSKLGYELDYFQIGFTAISIEYYKGWDFAIDGSDSNGWALAAVQRIEDYDIELYGTYRSYAFNASGPNYKDIDVFAAGVRWRF